MLNIIIPKIQKTSDLILEISHSSGEQRNASEQVNLTTQQLNGITQQNASVSEEMASSAEEMAAQAEKLLEIASSFRTDNKNIEHKSVSKNLKEKVIVKKQPIVKKEDDTHSLPSTPSKKVQKGFDLKLKPDTDDNFEKF